MANSAGFIVSLRGVLVQSEVFRCLLVADVVQRLGTSAISSSLELPKHTAHSRASGRLDSPEARSPEPVASSASLALAVSQKPGVRAPPTTPIPLTSLARGAAR